MLRQHTHFHINNWGAQFDDRAFCVSVMAGLFVEILFMLFSVYNMRNGLKMSEYEVY